MNTFENIKDKLSGRKTYLVSLLMIVFAVSGFFIGNVSQKEMIELILEALAIGGLRAAVTKGATY